MITNEELKAPNSDFDPYRCPECDVSVLRSEEIPPKLRPGIYRAEYRGPWLACPVHGIVQRKHDPRRASKLAAAHPWRDDDDGWVEVHSEAIDFLVEYQRRCVDPGCDLCVKVQEYLKPILATRHEEAMADHCRHAKHPEARVTGERGRCAICGKYWQRIEGIWFGG